MSQRVLVVGAGVIGLTCAVRLAEAGYETHVLARDLPLETTSAVAGALWLPYRAEPLADVSRWALRSLEVLTGLAMVRGTGVLLRTGVLLQHEPGRRPDWAVAMGSGRSAAGLGDAVEGAVGRRLPELRAQHDPAPGYRHGWAMTVPLADTGLYLGYLVRRLAAAGGTLTRMPLTALPPRGVVVNATGARARSMAADPAVTPVRGQVLVLDNPGVTQWLVDPEEVEGELTYVLPRSDDVVVGGTATEGDWNTRPDPVTAERMLTRAVELVPALRGTAVRSHRVGLRPARSTVRVESEARDDGHLVHCYGHGGSGFTLSWGCADDVLTMVRQLPGSGAPP